jgi:hypothetical protein
MSAGDRLMAAPHNVRRHVLDLLDQMTAPMHPREIERALAATGEFPRSERRKIVLVLKRLPIVAIGAGQP